MRRCVPYLIALMFVSATARGAVIIDIAGSINTTGQDQGGEFFDYSSTADSTNPIPMSTVNDGTVSLSVVDTGAPIFSTAYVAGTVYSVGAEIDFKQGTPVVSNLADAIANSKYLDLVVSSAALGNTPFDLKSISVSLWRNGTGAADTYQLVYDANGNGFDTGDALGSPVLVNTGTAAAATISYNASTIASNVTDAKVRLYFWNGTNVAGNTHLYNVTASYDVVPEPGAAMMLLAGLSMFALRRRRGTVAAPSPGC